MINFEEKKELFEKAEGMAFEFSIRAEAFREPEYFLEDAVLVRCQSEQEAQGYESRAAEIRKIICKSHLELSVDEWLIIKRSASEHDALSEAYA